MIRKKKILLLLLATSGGYCLAEDNAWSFLNQESSQNIAPQVCGIEDKAWEYKSGEDYVSFPKVESETAIISANSISGKNKDNQLLEGDVIGYKGDQTLTADWLLYNQPTNRVTAGDNVVLTRQYDSISSKWADYYLDLSKGTFTQAKVFMESGNMTGSGQQINVQDKNHLNVEQGMFTTCNPNDPSWYIQAQRFDIDYQDASGTARNATMYFESVPIFATPYMSFPLGQRKSGFLAPNFGGTSNSGFMAATPYYWNMAPNYDMTIAPKYWSNDGFMVSDEFRYMSESNIGSIYTEQVPYSMQTEGYRYYWSLTDTYSPIQNIKFGYNYNVVSDPNYFNDFGNFYSITNNVNLDQSAYASWTPTWGNAGIKVQNYQTLNPPGYPSTVSVYSSYPVINFNVKPQDIGAGFKASWTSQYANFYSPSMQSGDRVVLYPSVTYPMQASWGFSTPKLGYNYTYYDLGSQPGISNTAGQYQRALPVTSWDNGLYFDRPLSLGNNSYTQTIEPRLYYLYIPQSYQGNLPSFDTATATFNIDQLFSENRFSGFDRVNSANDVTIGATSRLINDSNGNEFMKLGVGYRYYITPQNEFLYGNQVQYSQLFLPTPNLITEVSNNWSKTISTNASFQYDTTYDTIDAWTAGIRFNPDDYKVINVRLRYQYQLPLLYYGWTPGQAVQNPYYENQYALDVSAQWPIYENKLFAIGRTNYDFTINQPLNILAGLEYNGGCWTVSAAYGQFVSNLGLLPGGTTLQSYIMQTYYLQFSFKGIGGVGTGDPSSDLSINIPGYMPLSQTPY